VVFHAEIIIGGWFNINKAVRADSSPSCAKFLDLHWSKLDGKSSVVNDNKVIARSGQFAEYDLHAAQSVLDLRVCVSHYFNRQCISTIAASAFMLYNKTIAD